MPRFRFHLYNDIEARDPVGRIFADFDAAHVDAIRNARAIMASELTAKGVINLSHWIEIEDDEGETLIVTFRNAVTVHP